MVRCKAVVVAAGAGAFGPNRPPLEGLPAYEATGAVQYYVRRREDLRGRRVVIAGGGDFGGGLGAGAARHRRLDPGGAPAGEIPRRAGKRRSARRMPPRRGEVELVIPYQLHALHGAGGVLEAVEVADLDGGTRKLAADVLLPFFGLSMDLGPIAGWGLALERHHVKVEPATCATSLPGVFAIGDVATYPGKLKLILQGFSEAAMAAHAIHPIVFPDTALHFEYSTSKGVPGVTSHGQ